MSCADFSISLKKRWEGRYTLLPFAWIEKWGLQWKRRRLRSSVLYQRTRKGEKREKTI